MVGEEIPRNRREATLKEVEGKETVKCRLGCGISQVNTEGFEDKKSVKIEIDESENHRSKCSEMREPRGSVENRCMKLEMELQNKVREYEALAAKFHLFEIQKVATEDELEISKRRIHELEEQRKRQGKIQGTSDLSENIEETKNSNDEEKVMMLMIENKVLELEKMRAENEVRVWKNKFGELESRVLLLEKENSSLRDMVSLESVKKMTDNDANVHASLGASSTCYSPVKRTETFKPEAGTPCVETPYSSLCFKREKGVAHLDTGLECGNRVRKQLAFEEVVVQQKMAPSTPNVGKPGLVGVIEVTDSDDETNGAGNKNVVNVKNHSKRIFLDQTDDEDINGFDENFPVLVSAKRKRASNIVASDSGSENDAVGEDDIPICEFIKKKHTDEFFHKRSDVSPFKEKGSPSKLRRSVRLRQREEVGSEENSPISDGDEMGEVSSESEGESLGGFIVGSSEDSDNVGNSSVLEDESESNVGYAEIISRIQRKRNLKSNWEFEADMLSAFGKDPVLCMKAVCALYRQQTADEKTIKGALHTNNRGFSKLDALRGTTLAEFLTDGDPHGDLKKSVEELRKYDLRGIELCRTLATRYSKQLFAIYKNKEDPFFRPS